MGTDKPCPKCHGKLELNDIQDETVSLECVTHGEIPLPVPQGHEEAIRTAYTRSVNLEKLEKLVNEEFQIKPIYEFTMDEEADIMENLQESWNFMD